ncbi:MAG TPA: RlmE family RNA methyltransferase [Treponemataceae bacterium]|nr:RlmE family RNA methyltransferase [Treponemataceae bacterium]
MPKDMYGKPDFWTKKAFSEGYPARSVYKLQEIDEKFNILKKGSVVLDLGAAPGSWTVFVLRALDGTGHVTAIDLKPLSKKIKANNLTFFEGDMTDADFRNEIKRNGPYDTIICDAAPATTGNKVVDTARSAGLVEMAIYYAQKMLKPGGNFVVKIFQSGDQQSFLKLLRETFALAKGFKPKACRAKSFETYLIGLDKKSLA